MIKVMLIIAGAAVGPFTLGGEDLPNACAKAIESVGAQPGFPLHEVPLGQNHAWLTEERMKAALTEEDKNKILQNYRAEVEREMKMTGNLHGEKVICFKFEG